MATTIHVTMALLEEYGCEGAAAQLFADQCAGFPCSAGSDEALTAALYELLSLSGCSDAKESLIAAFARLETHGNTICPATTSTAGNAAERQRAAAILRGALLGACRAGRSALVAALLAAGADPNASGPCRRCIGGGEVVVEAEASALAEACASGHIIIAEMLLDAGASVDGIPHPNSAKVPINSCSFGSVATTSPFTLPPELAAALEAAAAADGGGVKRRRSSEMGGLPVGSSCGIERGASAASAAPASIGSMHGVSFYSLDSLAWSDSDDEDMRNCDSAPCKPTSTRKLGTSGLPSGPEQQLLPGAVFALPPAMTPRTCLQSSLLLPASTAFRGHAAAPPLAPRPPRTRPRLPLKPLPPFPLMSSAAALPPLSSPSALLPLGPPPSLLSLPAPPRAASPLLAACRAGQPDAAALLLRRGAGVDVVRGSELLAATDPRVVDVLMAAAPALTAHLGAALVAAAGRRRAEVVAALLRHGADPAHERGMALCEASYQGHTEVLELLLRAGGPRLASTCGPALASARSLALRFGRLAAAEMLQPVGQVLGGSASQASPTPASAASPTAAAAL